MNNTITFYDAAVFFAYIMIVVVYGLFVYHRKKKSVANTNDYFLAEGALTWWAIGSSIIASNISAEQFIGMSGSGFALGIGIASYEWLAAIGLVIVAVFFMPIYLKNKIATMPQFLERRYNGTISFIMAVLWLLIYVFVNLSSILYLGALCLSTTLGVSFTGCTVILAIAAAIITLGGMKVIGYTDIIQVFFLILGGLATTYLSLKMVSTTSGGSGSVFDGFDILLENVPEHFHMIFEKGQLMIPDGTGGMKDAYFDLPGLAVLFGAMWVINLSYWGCNQYITQRALGADLATARKGMLFAAFLKLLMPLIVVIPGIAAWYLFKQESFGFQLKMSEAGVIKPDMAYPALLSFLPSGLKGLAFAALIAAIVASLAGKANSIATIFSLDIYRKLNAKADEKKLVQVGKITVIVAFALALVIAPALSHFGQVFQFIQEYTGYISVGVFTIFVFGMFWRRTTSTAAMLVAIISMPLSGIFSNYFPTMPFIVRMGYVFIILVITIITVSLSRLELVKTNGNLELPDSSYRKVQSSYIMWILLLSGIVSALYIRFW